MEDIETCIFRETTRVNITLFRGPGKSGLRERGLHIFPGTNGDAKKDVITVGGKLVDHSAFSPVDAQIKIKYTSLDWYLDLKSRGEMEVARSVQDELNTVIINDIKEALKITDYESFKRSTGAYLFNELLTSPDTCLYYGVSHVMDDDDIKYMTRPLNHGRISILDALTIYNARHHFIRHQDDIPQLVCSTTNGTLPCSEACIPLDREGYEIISRWGVPPYPNKEDVERDA